MLLQLLPEDLLALLLGQWIGHREADLRALAEVLGPADFATAVRTSQFVFVDKTCFVGAVPPPAWCTDLGVPWRGGLVGPAFSMNQNNLGLQKRVPVSVALTDFLGLPAGTPVSRTGMSSWVNFYIQANRLNNPQVKRTYLPDARLRRLFLPDESGPFGYFLIQRQLKHHFLPQEGTWRARDGTQDTPLVGMSWATFTPRADDGKVPAIDLVHRCPRGHAYGDGASGERCDNACGTFACPRCGDFHLRIQADINVVLVCPGHHPDCGEDDDDPPRRVDRDAQIVYPKQTTQQRPFGGALGCREAPREEVRVVGINGYRFCVHQDYRPHRRNVLWQSEQFAHLLLLHAVPPPPQPSGFCPAAQELFLAHKDRLSDVALVEAGFY